MNFVLPIYFMEQCSQQLIFQKFHITKNYKK